MYYRLERLNEASKVCLSSASLHEVSRCMLSYPSPKEVIFHRDVTGPFYEALINSSFNLKNSESMANLISTLKKVSD